VEKAPSPCPDVRPVLLAVAELKRTLGSRASECPVGSSDASTQIVQTLSGQLSHYPALALHFRAILSGMHLRLFSRRVDESTFGPYSDGL
jgi:hypothetical protein